MSSKFKILGSAAVALLVLGLYVSTAQADVTGSFGTHISLHPQTTATEIELIDFDVQNELNLVVAISGLTSKFHTHFGIAGVEDVMVSASATLGALDVNALVVFARFPCVAPPGCLPVSVETSAPFYDELHFIKKKVDMTLTLGGVVFTNTAIFEDTNAFLSQTPAYAFGDVFGLSGQTPSGIAVTAMTGICAEEVPNSIKKHWKISPYSVNSHCATEPKPDILFDFESLWIEGVPIAPNVTVDSHLECVKTGSNVLTPRAPNAGEDIGCLLETDFIVAGGPVPFVTSLTFTNILQLEFGGALIILTSGAGTLVLAIGEDGQIGAVAVEVEALLNPDTNSALLAFEAVAVPGIGLVSASVHLEVSRAGLSLGAWAIFGGGPPVTFQALVFHLSVPGSLVSISADSTFTDAGLVVANIWLEVHF